MPVARRNELLALLAGAVYPLGFSPFYLFPLTVFSLAVLFVLWSTQGLRRSAWLGFLFGIGLFGVGTSWVFVSMHNFGNMNTPLAGLATLLFVAVLAVFPALAGIVQAYFARHRPALRVVLAAPVAWTLAEWFRGWVFTGFPVLDAGYSQTSAPLGGLAPWLGIYGIGLATALSAGLVAAWVGRGWRAGWRFGVALAALWALGFVAGLPSWGHKVGQPLKVALVQGNIPLGIKWLPQFRRGILDTYLKLSAAHPDARLVIWPEGAVPAYLDDLPPDFVSALTKEAKRDHQDFLFGAVDRQVIDGRVRYYNAVTSFGSARAVYRKHHLVPFGEYAPMGPLFRWLMTSMQIPMANFSSGPVGQPPLKVAGQRAAIAICYETAFAAETAAMAPPATLIVNVSEDAWYGDSLAPHQLLQMARMRAKETARPVLRADNAGLSAAISARGTMLAVARQFHRGVLVATVQGHTGLTPYVRFRNAPVVSLCFLILAGLWVVDRRKRRP